MRFKFDFSELQSLYEHTRDPYVPTWAATVKTTTIDGQYESSQQTKVEWFC